MREVLQQMGDVFQPNNSEPLLLTSIDVKQSFWSLPLKEDIQKYFGFSGASQAKSYKYKRLPMGYMNSSSEIQCAIEYVLNTLSCKRNCLVSTDDLLIFSTAKDHLNIVHEVITALSRYGFLCGMSKLQLCKKELTFLGHRITVANNFPQMTILRSRKDAIANFAPPTNVKGVRRFCGMVGYISQWIPDLATLLKPIHALTRKSTRFHWTIECQNNFDIIKNKISNSPTLTIPCDKEPITIYVDSSKKNLGGLLTVTRQNKELPVAFFSKSYDTHKMRNYSASEYEAMGIVLALDSLRPVIHNHPCTLVSDHCPIINMKTNKKSLPSRRLEKMFYIINSLPVQFKHLAGSKMFTSDCLSRCKYLKDDESDSIEPLFIDSLTNIDTLPRTAQVINTLHKDGNVNTLEHTLCTHPDPDNNELMEYPSENRWDEIWFKDHNEDSDISVVTRSRKTRPPPVHGVNKPSYITKHLPITSKNIHRSINKSINKSTNRSGNKSEHTSTNKSKSTTKHVTFDKSVRSIDHTKSYLTSTPIKKGHKRVPTDFNMSKIPIKLPGKSNISLKVDPTTTQHKLELDTSKQRSKYHTSLPINISLPKDKVLIPHSFVSKTPVMLPQDNIIRPNIPLQNIPMTSSQNTDTLVDANLYKAPRTPKLHKPQPPVQQKQQRQFIEANHHLPVRPSYTGTNDTLISEKYDHDITKLTSVFKPLKSTDALVKTYKKFPKNLEISDLSKSIEYKNIRDLEIPTTSASFARAQKADQYFGPIIKILDTAHSPISGTSKYIKSLVAKASNFVLYGDLLYHISWDSKEKQIQEITLCVPEIYVYDILNFHHNLVHSGSTNLYLNIRKNYFFPKALFKVNEFVMACKSCLNITAPKGSIYDSYRTYHATESGQCYHMDIKYMQSNKYPFPYLLILVDEISRFLIVRPLKTRRTEEILDNLDFIFHTYTFPSNMVLDLAGEFTSESFRAYMEAHTIKLTYCSPENHRGSLAERRIGSLQNYIFKLLTKNPKVNWITFIREITYAINSTKSPALAGYSPHELFFYRKTNLPIIPAPLAAESNIPSSYEDMYNAKHHQLQTIWNVVQDYRKKSQDTNIDRQQRRSNTKSLFCENDFVYVMQCQPLDGFENNKKAMIRWVGPFVISQFVGSDKVILSDLFGSRLNKMYGLRRLKLAKVSYKGQIFSTLSALTKHMQSLKVPSITDEISNEIYLPHERENILDTKGKQPNKSVNMTNIIATVIQQQKSADSQSELLDSTSSSPFIQGHHLQKDSLDNDMVLHGQYVLEDTLAGNMNSEAYKTLQNSQHTQGYLTGHDFTLTPKNKMIFMQKHDKLNDIFHSFVPDETNAYRFPADIVYLNIGIDGEHTILVSIKCQGILSDIAQQQTPNKYSFFVNADELYPSGYIPKHISVRGKSYSFEKNLFKDHLFN